LGPEPTGPVSICLGEFPLGSIWAFILMVCCGILKTGAFGCNDPTPEDEYPTYTGRPCTGEG